MNEKNERNIRLVRGGGRRVTRTESAPAQQQDSAGEALRKRVSYQKRQKELRLKKRRRALALSFIFIIILVLILLFLTPIFSIRQIYVAGNNVVTDEQITEQLKPLVGQNILRTSDSRVKGILKELPYIKDANVTKKMLPPSLNVEVEEYESAAIIRTEGKSILISSSLNSLEMANGVLPSLPVITGIEPENTDPGDVITLGSEEKEETLRIILSTLESTGIISKIREIAIGNMTAITLNYDDRITVQCGSQLEMERKLRLFREAVLSDALAENARGTIDLSETGKAVYTP